MTTAAQMLAECARHLGVVESPAGSNKNPFSETAGHAPGKPWCATFLVACARNVGLALPNESAWTPAMASGFKSAGAWHATPEPGDFVFFDWPDTVRRIQHVGIVEQVHEASITTIEGNTSPTSVGSQSNGGGVHRRTRPRNISVSGYGRPAYAADSGGTAMTPEQWDEFGKFRSAVQKNEEGTQSLIQDVRTRLTRIEDAILEPVPGDLGALVRQLEPLIELARKIENG